MIKNFLLKTDCYNRYQKKINDLYVEYQVTKIFANVFINYYLEKVNTGEYYGSKV